MENSNTRGADEMYGLKYCLSAWSGVVGYSGEHDGLRMLGRCLRTQKVGPLERLCQLLRKALANLFHAWKARPYMLRTDAPAI